MSTASAIAATTRILFKVLTDALADLEGDGLEQPKVSMVPLDKARSPGELKDQLNLFLYQTTTNAAWRNLSPPLGARDLGTGSPPLALNLHYLLTAYDAGDAGKDSRSHHILGAAMLALHENAILNRSRLQDERAGEQIEHLRITPLPLTLEDLSKLWMVAQAPYRISVAYEVTVVLIDARQSPAALPVLRRGPDDRGPEAVAAFPNVLTAIVPEGRRPAARLGEVITLEGQGLTAAGWQARVVCRRRGLEAILPVKAGAPGRLSVELDADARFRDPKRPGTQEAGWIAGVHGLSLVKSPSAGGTLAPEFAPDASALPSNELPLLIAPTVKRFGAATLPLGASLDVTCHPAVLPEQSCELLFGGIQRHAPEAPLGDGAELRFVIAPRPAGTYPLRLRVDGVDSIPITPDNPGFDPDQSVTVG